MEVLVLGVNSPWLTSSRQPFHTGDNQLEDTDPMTWYHLFLQYILSLAEKMAFYFR